MKRFSFLSQGTSEYTVLQCIINAPTTHYLFVSSHQGAEGPPWGLGHPEVIEYTGEDGAFLGPVDLHGARPQNLHPIQVQRGSQVVGDLASN